MKFGFLFSQRRFACQTTDFIGLAYGIEAFGAFKLVFVQISSSVFGYLPGDIEFTSQFLTLIVS